MTVFCGALFYKYTRHRGAGAAAGQPTLARAERAGGDEIAALVRQDRVMVTADPAGAAAVAVETGATEVGVADPAAQKPLLLALKMSLEDFPGGPPDGDYAENGKGLEEDDAALVAGEFTHNNEGRQPLQPSFDWNDKYLASTTSLPLALVLGSHPGLLSSFASLNLTFSHSSRPIPKVRPRASGRGC